MCLFADKSYRWGVCGVRLSDLCSCSPVYSPVNEMWQLFAEQHRVKYISETSVTLHEMRCLMADIRGIEERLREGNE